MKHFQVLIRRLDYERAFEAGCNHPDEIRAEKTDCAKFGPSLKHISDLTPFGSDVLIAENLPTNAAAPFDRERIPHSGHVICVHGETYAEDVLIEFNLSGFGPHDLRVGEFKKMSVRQKIAIDRSKAQKPFKPRQTIPTPSSEVDDYYG